MNESRLSWARIPRGWWVIFLMIWLLDLVVLPLHEAATTFDIRPYAGSVALTLIFVLAIETIRRLLPRGWRLAYVLVAAFIVAFVIATSIAVYSQFGEFVTVSMAQFVLTNPTYFASFVRSALFNIKGIGFLALWLLIAWLWTPRKRPRHTTGVAIKLVTLAALVVAYLVILNQIHWHSKGEKLTADTSLALALKRYASPNAEGLHSAARTPVVPFSPADSCNVILIINESFGKEAFDYADSTNHAMPFLRQWIDDERERFVVFDKAFTNSSATDVSVPSILTGAAPWESSRALHTMPLLWDWAKAAGMRTVFVSAQLYNWGNFESFLLSPGPDIFVTPTQMKEPLRNDVGVDEIVGLRRFCAELRGLPRGSHFLAIYNSNALHWPFQESSPLVATKSRFESPYLNAATILDEGFRELRVFLDSTGLIENTLIVITSDHGERDKLLHGKVNRLYCFYDEIMNIPFLIRMPERLLSRHPESGVALRENATRLVSNIDVAPTILDLIGAFEITVNQTMLSALSGRSLLRQAPADRCVIALNTNDIRQWEHEGFGIFWKNKRFVFSDLEGARYFDIMSDPDQMNDLWAGAPESERQLFLGVIDSTFHLRRMMPR